MRINPDLQYYSARNVNPDIKALTEFSTPSCLTNVLVSSS